MSLVAMTCASWASLPGMQAGSCLPDAVQPCPGVLAAVCRGSFAGPSQEAKRDPLAWTATSRSVYSFEIHSQAARQVFYVAEST